MNTFANVLLEVAEYYPDVNMDIPRAEWRTKIIALTNNAISECNIDENTEDIDEVIRNYFSKEEELS